MQAPRKRSLHHPGLFMSVCFCTHWFCMQSGYKQCNKCRGGRRQRHNRIGAEAHGAQEVGIWLMLQLPYSEPLVFASVLRCLFEEKSGLRNSHAKSFHGTQRTGCRCRAPEQHADQAGGADSIANVAGANCYVFLSC